ncbi:MAG: LptF/LptG family permease [Bacteroidota bacterium]
MIKKLDLYIIRKFLGTFVFAILLIITIVIVFDISEKIDDFLERNAPIYDIIFVYYLNFVPYFVNLFSPLFTFISVIFFTSKMAANTEIIAILGSGISFNRILRPYIFSSIIIGIFSFYLTNFVIPPTNLVRLNFEARYLKNPKKVSDYNIHRQLNPNTNIYLETYYTDSDIGYEFTQEMFSENKLAYKLTASTITWDSIKKSWKLQDVRIRKIYGMQEELKYYQEIDTVLQFKPIDLSKEVANMDAMNMFELNRYIDKEEIRGSDNLVFLLVERHKRFATPFCTIILTLIGVSLASRKTRGGIGVHIGLGITLSFAYILFIQVTTTFATLGSTPPIVAVWIPNMVFALLSVYLIKKAPK